MPAAPDVPVRIPLHLIVSLSSCCQEKFWRVALSPPFHLKRIRHTALTGTLIKKFGESLGCSSSSSWFESQDGRGERSVDEWVMRLECSEVGNPCEVRPKRSKLSGRTDEAMKRSSETLGCWHPHLPLCTAGWCSIISCCTICIYT